MPSPSDMPSWGRRPIPLLGFLYVFHIPINELKKQLRFLAITALHSPPGQAGYLLLEFLDDAFCMTACFPKPSMFLCCLPLLARLPACMTACLLSLARIRCRLAGLPCHLPRFRDDQFAATLCIRRATPCSCLTIRERGRERNGKGGRDREIEREREGQGGRGERKRER